MLMNLASFLRKYSCPTCEGYNQDTQHQAIDFPEKIGNVECLFQIDLYFSHIHIYDQI